MTIEIPQIKKQVRLMTPPLRDKKLYKTSSFTVLKTVWREFVMECKKENRAPSDVLRELMALYIDSRES